VLTELRIEHLGVIEEVHLLLGPGLIALTGETGAGKTMIVEAIELLMGARADPVVVRPGASEARIEGRFVLGEREIVLARVVPAEGRSRAYVDGRLATLGNLAEIGAGLVDLHGQHAHQSLLSPAAQRRALDRFAGVDLEPLRTARARLADVVGRLDALGGDARARAREIDLLRFQVDELSAAGLDDPAEDERLERQEELLAGAVAHREAAAAALEGLVGDDGVLDRLGWALSAIDHRGVFNDEAGRLAALQAELADISGELRRRAEQIEEDPERLADVRARRRLLHELRRKYGDTLADVIAYRDNTAARLDELASYEERVAGLEAERERCRAEVDRAARAVGAQRRAAAPELGRAVEAHLRALAMPTARVVVSVGDEREDPAGESVLFQLAANPGSPPLPLAKVASGGELARTMLALRLVLTEAPGTLVFDEVDAGIGGAAANAVARALAELGQRHQVVVVTHLAQVAAAAQQQVVVEKRFEQRAGADTAVASARTLTTVERVGEVARMLSGDAAAASARRHAAELLGIEADVPRAQQRDR
jgi:DNA repair protein RecN (Recombination protein N)